VVQAEVFRWKHTCRESNELSVAGAEAREEAQEVKARRAPIISQGLVGLSKGIGLYCGELSP